MSMTSGTQVPQQSLHQLAVNTTRSGAASSAANNAAGGNNAIAAAQAQAALAMQFSAALNGSANPLAAAQSAMLGNPAVSTAAAMDYQQLLLK